MKTKKYLFSLLGLLLFSACEQATEIIEIPVVVEEPPIVENPMVTKSVFSGYVQKGPFTNGSSVLISELDSMLNQTGRVYSTRIISNAGAFEQKNIELVSPYVELKADGYYFDEVLGKISPGQITLYALVDVSDISSANVNVLTHLVKPRIEYLVKEEKLPFAAAKIQAEKEVLSIFDLTLPETTGFESFNLTDNATLIAVSSILQGYSQTADVVMQLMSDVLADIQIDGILDDEAIGSRLASNANALNLKKIRENLEKRYVDLNIEAEIPDFESLVSQFLEKTSYKIASLIKYPEFGYYLDNAPNVLAENNTEFKVSDYTHITWYPVTVEVPEGMPFRMVLKSRRTDDLDYPYYLHVIDSWVVGDIIEKDDHGFDRDFTLRVDHGKVAEFSICFVDEKRPVTIECYENNSSEPTFVKIITPI